MPNGAHLVGYADDVAAIIVTRNVEEKKDQPGVNKNEVMARGQRTQIDNGENGLEISY